MEYRQMASHLGPNSINTTCPSCKAQIQTKIDQVAANKAHIIALIMCLVGLWCCCCIPYCLDGMKVTKHTCPRCGALVGTYAPE